MGTNVCVVEGRLTKDAEYTEFGQNSTPKLSFSLANNTGFGDYQKTNYFNCEIIGKMAASLSQYMLKGKACNLNGEMQQQRWEDADGNKHNKWLIHVRGVSFTSGSKSDTQESRESAPKELNNVQKQSSFSPTGSHQGSQQASSPPKDPFAAALAASKPTEEFEDDIPF